MVPGLYHCSGGQGASSFDMLPALEEWVEKGVAPEKISATQCAGNQQVGGFANPTEGGTNSGEVLMTQPLFLYLLSAQYDGQGVTVEAMRLIGGGASALWRQILADVYNLPILRVSLSAEATALGAAIAGGVRVGLYPDYSVANQLVPVVAAEQPNPASRTRYEALYELFKASYVALEPIYERLANLPD